MDARVKRLIACFQKAADDARSQIGLVDYEPHNRAMMAIADTFDATIKCIKITFPETTCPQQNKP